MATKGFKRSRSKQQQTLRVTVKLQPELKNAEQFEARLAALEAGLLEKILRKALVESVLMAWRKRALDGFEETLRMRRHFDGRSRPLVNPRQAARARKALEAAGDALAQEQLEGRVSKKTQKRLERAADQFVQAHESPRGPSELSTGQFRIEALRVLHTMVDASKIGVRRGRTRMLAGIGNLPELLAIETPSATELVSRRPTTSNFKSLWRHLEFGTGIHGLRGRDWWFGPRPGKGLHLEGSHGWHAIFKKGERIAYREDALRFEKVFGGLLVRALAGKR